jgi:non-specific serine/threonine protein kinase
MGQSEPQLPESNGWEVNLAARELRVHGVAVPIGSRAFEIVELLAQSAGELVTKDDLMRRVWPGAIVEDNTIQVHISAIRKALGGDRGLLKTVSGQGYRLLGDWTIRRERTPAAPGAPERGRGEPSSFQTNVPVAAAALVGREKAVQQLHDLLSAYRAVTLAGPGGIGKTVLASEVARRFFPTSKSDIFFVELVSLADPDLVPSAVVSVLGLQLGGGEISPASVARAIGGRKLLLVLDNCEHVIDAAAHLAETLLHTCPGVTVLATSREVLRIEGETVYHVAPLEVPSLDPETTGNAIEYSAVQLFITRMRSLQEVFRLEGESVPVIAAICRRLDGIPLALELAAAQAATLGVDHVAGHLDDRFALLVGGRRTALPRHRTLQATLDWSYNLLPEPERRLLRHLAIFPAGFTLEAAAAVLNEPQSGVAVSVSSLVSKSLVTTEGSETGRRWRLLETVRVYSREKLAASGEEEPAVRRHAEYYLALFAPFALESLLQAALDDLARYRREIDNLRAAMNWAFSPGGDAGLGVELAATAADFWVAASLVAEAREWGDVALTHIDSAAGARSEMVLQCNLGFALIYTKGMTSDAREALTRAIGLARKLEDFDYQQRATYGLWLFSARSMAVNDALAFAREYEEVAQVLDLQSRATAAWLVGIPQIYLGRHVEASERLQWAIDHYPVERRSRDLVRFGADLRASALGHNSVNLLSQGLLDAASRAVTSAIEEARGTNQPTVLCVALTFAASFIFLSLDETEKASLYGEELLSHAYRHGLRPFHAAGLCVRGSLAARRGEAETGINLLHSGLDEMKKASYLLFDPFFRVELALALGVVGRIDHAIGEIDEALRSAAETGYQWFVPEILRNKGELLARRGLDDRAAIDDLFRQSMRQSRAQQAVYWELCAATSLAETLQGRHKEAEARRVLAPVYDRLTEGFFASRVKRAKTLLDQLA